MVFTAGCEVSADLAIDVNDDGSGTVRLVVNLDRDAVAAVEQTGGALEDEVRLDDLDESGWDVAWQRHGQGATLRLTKNFGRAEQLATVIEELDGPAGPLRGVELERDAEFIETDLRVAGAADLAAIDTGISSDEELVAALAAERVDITALDAALVAQVRDAFELTVSVSLPSEDTRTFSVAPGDTVDLSTEASVRDWRRIGWLLTAGVSAVGAVVVFLCFGRHNRRHGATT